eukprot:TRINITY_DN3307_c0_g1_i1.p2 TRINITY_DN3307_c0_g1~~TRINITY_DN3307_c0_g1_i1.p2  ORF type:complete len:54 (+),score=2.75 TRINITY_DN3307_c0_g1_i1:232-393(+)
MGEIIYKGRSNTQKLHSVVFSIPCDLQSQMQFDEFSCDIFHSSASTPNVQSTC